MTVPNSDKTCYLKPSKYRNGILTIQLRILCVSWRRGMVLTGHLVLTLTAGASVQDWVPGSRHVRGASLNEYCMAGITNSHWLWWRRQRQLVVRAGIAKNFPTVSTVVLLNGEIRKKGKKAVRSHFCCQNVWAHFLASYLSFGEWKFLLTKLAVCCLFVFQPDQSLTGKDEC